MDTATRAENQSTSRKWLDPASTNDTDEIVLLAKGASAKSEELKQLAHDSLGGFDLNQYVQVNKDGLLEQLATVGHHGALSAKADWADSRKHGAGKFGAKVQSFATSLSNFLDVFSGIVDAVKTAGGPYGSAGYQAISLLLIVAVKKSKNDDFITSELDKMTDMFPRIKLYDEIYSDDKIKRYVLRIHASVIMFSKEATRYFLSASRRFRTSLRLREQEVHCQIEDLKRNLFELNAWATVLLHERIGRLGKGNSELLQGNKKIWKHNEELLKGKDELLQNTEELKNKNLQLLDEVAGLKHANERLLKKVSVLESNLEDMKKRDLARERQLDMDNLERIRRSLRRQEENLEETLMHYRRNLDIVFPTTLDTGKPSAKYLQMSLSLLEEQQCYQDWWESKMSCLLLLSGTTVPEGRKQPCGYSWLSPAASDLAERLRRNGDLVAFFNCHPNFEVQSEEEPQVTELVASLLFQILKSQPHILREDHERRSGKLQIEAWARPKSKDSLEAMLEPVSDMLRNISDERWTYLVIDRADRCKIRLVWLLEWLHKIISHEECKVKVFVVWESTRSNIDTQDWDSFEEIAAGRVYNKLRWYQERTQPYNKSPLRKPYVKLESDQS